MVLLNVGSEPISLSRRIAEQVYVPSSAAIKGLSVKMEDALTGEITCETSPRKLGFLRNLNVPF